MRNTGVLEVSSCQRERRAQTMGSGKISCVIPAPLISGKKHILMQVATEDIYDDLPKPIGFMRFAPVKICERSYLRRRLPRR
jgi:hypothetical protein